MDNEQLVIAAKLGDIISKENLFMQNQGIIRKICFEIAYDSFEFQDLIQESYFALCRAIDKFDSGHGCKFITYYVKALKRHLYRYLIHSRGKESLTLNKPMNDDENVQNIDVIKDEKATDFYDRIETEYLKEIPVFRS